LIIAPANLRPQRPLPATTDHGQALLNDARSIADGMDWLCAKGSSQSFSLSIDAMYPMRALTEAVGSFRGACSAPSSSRDTGNLPHWREWHVPGRTGKHAQRALGIAMPSRPGGLVIGGVSTAWLWELLRLHAGAA
jgi:hypothetical protein